MQHFLRFIPLLLLLTLSQQLHAQFYERDPGFQPLQVKRNQGFVQQLILQPDQKILIKGGYHFIRGRQTDGFNRLYPDGSLDSSFKPTSEIFTPLWVTLRKDNKILTANIYSRPNGKNGVTVFLLRPDGKLDSTFHTDIESAGIYAPKAFAVHTDNSMVVGTPIMEGSEYKFIISRINPDGSTATLYKSTLPGSAWISSLQFQPDGKILATGIFPMADGSTKSLIRLLPQGGLDESFQPLQLPGFLMPPTLTLLPDGKMLIGQYGPALTRLHADGRIDNTFYMTYGDWNRVDRILLQPDGKMLLSVWTNDNVNHRFGYARVVRFNPDGTLDNTFNCGPGAADYEIDLMALQANGDVLLGGFFKEFNNNTQVALVRLKGTDGSLDASFVTRLESNGHMEPLIQQTDGKLLIGGSFDIANDKLLSHIARLNTDGRIDTTFKVGTGVDGFWDINGGVISSLALQADQRILAGGYFTSFNGYSAPSLVRLNPDGRVDSLFKPAVNEHHAVNTILLQPDGKIVIGASKQFNEEFNKFIYRLNPDGSLDTGFKTDITFTTGVTKIVAQPDGKLLIAGFTTTPTGEFLQNIFRLSADGKTDSTFVSSSAGGGFYRSVSSMVVQPDGKIMVGGGFTSFNGTAANKMVRLNANGTVDVSFASSVTASSEISSVLVRPDGRLLAGGNFFNMANRTLNQFTANGQMEYSVFLSEELPVFEPALLMSGNDLIVSGNSRAYRLIRRLTGQGITFDAIPNQHPEAGPFILQVSTTSNLPVTLQITEGPATLTGNTVTLTGQTGKVTIRASQPGNDFYTPALVERSFMVDPVLGVENTLSQEIALFPNPTQGDVIVRLPANTPLTQIQLLNSQGQTVQAPATKITDGLLIRTSGLPGGIYIVRVITGNQQISQKLLIE